MYTLTFWVLFPVFRYLTEKYLFQINCEVEEEPYNQPKITIGQGQLFASQLHQISKMNIASSLICTCT